jgi:sugar/nucleoside kinase (ribokinase family)
MSQIEVLSVGDIVTDAFIKLLDNQAHTYNNEHGAWLAMPFGTKVPFDHAEVIEAVGNAANAAVCFARLDLKSAMYANVGEDKYGRDMIRALHKKKVDSRFVRINPDKISNYHYVLWYGNERTILIKHEEYEYYCPDGAYASGPEGRFKMPNYPDPKPPVERTGAGDAFASTFVAELVKGNTMVGALQVAPINSMNVVQHVGAQAGLLDNEHISALLRIAPDWYKPQPL